MAFKWAKSLTNNTPIMLSLPKTASVVITVNSAVDFDGSGAVTPSTSATNTVAGVFAGEAVAASDSDYASNTAEKVIVDPFAIYEADVTTGTMTTALVGTTCDLTDADGLDVGSTSTNVALLVGFVSASKALCILESSFNLSA